VQAAIREVNTGTYCFDSRVLLEHLDRLDTGNAQGRVLPHRYDGALVREGLGVVAIPTDDPAETLGVNSRVQLAEAAGCCRRASTSEHMLAGVTMIDPELVWIGPG
jgi:bifunctional UDP-N-acetylglucosamine pyrophosphorylase / glucosamine-1-phosphate N-acetyltransferase